MKNKEIFMFKFEIKKELGKARRGVLHTPHGKIDTPAFVPVATCGALKGMSFKDCKDVGADIFMMNTFHFYCRDEHKIVKKMGGLHKFLNIDYPIMTDSGGFQVFSLGAGWQEKTGKIYKEKEGKVSNKKKSNVIIKEDSVVFSSPTDGKKVKITPKSSINAQKNLGADIIFAFDECTSPLASYEYQKKSLKRTNRWAEQSLEALSGVRKQKMFGIVQGGRFADLRKESARYVSSLPFFGFGIGGSFGDSFGDSKKNMYSILDSVTDILPSKKPRHFLGIGEPQDIVESVLRGVDLFDCVIPTRFARHNTALTSEGRINVWPVFFKDSKKPLDKRCSCFVCKNHTRGYIHHLARKKEIYAIMLLTHHNLFFILNLMKEIRALIEKGKSIDNYFNL